MLRRLAFSLFAAVVLTTTAFSQVFPAQSQAHGKSLQQWLTSYWQWYYATGGIDVFQPTSAPVVFLPIPAGELITDEAPWTYQGSVEITIPTGTAFVLPAYAWVTERYDPDLGYPDDEFFSNQTMFEGVFYPGDPTRVPAILLNGKPVARNFWDHYIGPTLFPEPVMYENPTVYGSIAALGFQGVGFVYHPLPPGTHVLTIYEELKLDDIGADVVYDNTWIIHVVPRGKNKEP